MKRTLVLLLAALAALAVFVGLVYVVLMATHLSESAATTVQGPTTRRLWATTASVLALISVVIGGLAMVRSTKGFGTAARLGVILALAAGLFAVINGALVLTVANGGLGSGNGVVGGAVALVLGLIGVIIGGLALSRSRRRTVAGSVAIE
jgi:uncharacterized protein DUF6223